jgi:phenylalanyl-tRNA synthetase beta chain
MKVSLSWLKEYVALEWEADRLAEALTMAGLEVDSIYDRFAYLQDVKVAQVETVRPHPQADKLKLCDVSIGDGLYTVVCGAPNVREGMISALALPGTVLPDGRTLAETQIRGVASQGMLCSEAELELGADASGIWSLPEDLPLGVSLAEALRLSDIVLDIDLTPNRPDCLSMIGVAREAAALQGGVVRYPDTRQDDDRQAVAELTSVTIEDPDLCPRYTARLIEDVTIGPSPAWLQDRIRSVGMRPINNVVDVTNFVMMELGQPLHAFDFDRLTDHRIVVRRARDGETFISLDNKERVLDSRMLMICDGAKPVAIGGVMGGLNSEVVPETRRVLLESACFNPVSIRRTAKRLGLASEASHRFERGVDPRGTVAALNRAAKLIAELGQGRLVEGHIDAHPGDRAPQSLSLDVERANRLLGTTLTGEEMVHLLAAIEIEAGLDSEGVVIEARPPSFRVDIHQPEDLVEEIARLWGYNRIPPRRPHVTAASKVGSERTRDVRRAIRSFMVGFGFTETINYSFISERAGDLLKLPEDDPRRAVVKILNPLTEDQNVMRTSLVPGLIETTVRNLAQQTRDVKVFETGKGFISRGTDRQPEEREVLAALWTGMRHESVWNRANSACDFYDIKGVLEGLLSGLRVHNVQFIRPLGGQAPFLEDGNAAAVLIDGQSVGFLGELHSDVRANFNLKQPAFIFEIDLGCLIPLIPDEIQAVPLPRFPSTSRDITLILDDALDAQSVLSAIQKMENELVESVSVFDVFKDKPIPPGKKSLSLRVVYRSHQGTLEDEAVNAIHHDLTHRLLKVCKADLPS